jgi:hypothetical protein
MEENNNKEEKVEQNESNLDSNKEITFQSLVCY